MRVLWILRHAKAAPHDAKDHARPLAPRGRRQCAELASHLASMVGARPTLVLCSSAVRAQQTAEGVVEGLGDGAVVEVEPALYQADPDEVLDLVRGLGDSRDQVMVVGHNPTLLELLELVIDPADGFGRHSLERGLPTAALAAVSFDVARWAEVSAERGRLQSLYVPKAR